LLSPRKLQDRIFEIETSSNIWIYSLITKASVEMISPDGGIAVLADENQINYYAVVMAWLGSPGKDRWGFNPLIFGIYGRKGINFNSSVSANFSL